MTATADPTRPPPAEASRPVAGVMGWPVAHSRSPRLHGHWLARYGIDGAYVPMAVPPTGIARALASLATFGFRGCNVTVPHKEAAFAAMDRVDPAAQRIGAVNTVVLDADGTLHGSNTDGFGFLESLRADSAWQADSGPAAVIGAGGAARAIVAALLDAGAPEVRLTNRSAERAAAVAEALGGPITVVPWADRAAMLDGAALLVNTTTLGMDGQPPLDLALDPLPPRAVVTDIVYTPLETPLLAAARARGNPVVDGLGMLLHQARPGFEAWFGVAPTVDSALRAAVLDAG
ncbi:MAG: shikimate dehydrogenase [Deinococcus-Thermus bacterium]|jgi:shikimate dehydrogenase|nr:shikimate dehydrogenase [Deinococcota bacterium]